MVFNQKCLVTTIQWISKRHQHWFKDAPMGPPDPILGISEAYKKSKSPKKVNVGVGAYRDDNGKPFILSCVRKAEEKMMTKNLNHEYLPILGMADFYKAAAKLAFGDDSPLLSGNRLLSAQSLSGTGALRLGFEMLVHFFSGQRVIHLPIPTWGNHMTISELCGMKYQRYKYFDPANCGFAQKECFDDINKMPEKSIILLHACAQNPTGVDPTHEQWKEMSALVKKKQLFTFFDMAYQGFASGDIARDAFAVRQFIKDGNSIILAQSFAKNMGLYGERIGGFHMMVDPEEHAKCASQLKIVCRGIYSNPPVHGARIVHEILTDSSLRSLWLKEVKGMSDRILSARAGLLSNLKKLGSKKNWDHITKQIGMFCYTGMNSQQVERLTKEFEIYLTKDGRISMAGVCSKNVDYLAKCMHEVTK